MIYVRNCLKTTLVISLTGHRKVKIQGQIESKIDLIIKKF
jgi:hypothetical protein